MKRGGERSGLAEGSARLLTRTFIPPVLDTQLLRLPDSKAIRHGGELMDDEAFSQWVLVGIIRVTRGFPSLSQQSLCVSFPLPVCGTRHFLRTVLGYVFNFKWLADGVKVAIRSPYSFAISRGSTTALIIGWLEQIAFISIKQTKINVVCGNVGTKAWTVFFRTDKYLKRKYKCRKKAPGWIKTLSVTFTVSNSLNIKELEITFTVYKSGFSRYQGCSSKSPKDSRDFKMRITTIFQFKYFTKEFENTLAFCKDNC